MRTLMPHLRRLDRDEEGVTIVIVALTLIALFGMLVLVVDVGGLLLERRAMVNASDAAALAAAKSCILDDSFTAETAADRWALENSNRAATGPANITASFGCLTDAEGYVSVTYDSDQPLFFAPVLGFGGSATVATEATAVWGPPGAANPIPIIVYANSFNNCRLDEDPTDGPQCYIWEDNNNTQGAQSGFGFLDLRTDDPSRYGWDSVPGAACSDPGSGLMNLWIEQYPDPDVGDLRSNWPEPTYVCRASGLRESGWINLEALIGQTLFFPINRCDAVPPGDPYGQIASDTTEVPCGNTPHQYDVIGFVALVITEIYRPNEVEGTPGACGPDVRSFPSASPLDLDAFGVGEGCFTAAPDVIDTASVSVRRVPGGPLPSPVRGPDGSSCTGTTVDWCYDPATRIIQWNGPGPAADNQNYEVDFDFLNGGPCGIPPAGNNAGHCMTVEIVDVAVGGSRPGEGDPNSNIRAYKLCDFDVPGSCDPIVQVP